MSRQSSFPVHADIPGAEVVIDPRTGEAHPIHAAPLDALAAARDTIRDFEEQAKDAKRWLDAEILVRLDQQAKWSWSGNGYSLKAPSPAPSTEYRADELRGRLEELVADGLLSMEAVDSAVEVVTSFKPRIAGINALRKLGPPVSDTIEECSSTVEKPRRVSVSRC